MDNRFLDLIPGDPRAQRRALDREREIAQKHRDDGWGPDPDYNICP
ncbi:MAG: hypothetical protein AAGJ28_00505 [Pseudomonadota bacterium]